MTTAGVEIVATTTGTGVTETRLNTDSAVILPDDVREIVEIVPFQVSNGAMTAGQGYLSQMRLQSPDVNVEPKRFILDPIQGGLSTIFNSLAPILKARALNVNLKGKGGQRINVYGQSQVANTVAPLMGGSLICGEVPRGLPEVFYEKPDNETATGTTAGTRTQGNAITVSTVKMIFEYYCAITNAVQTVSESIAGRMEIGGSDLNTAMPQIYPVQPAGAFLGATASITPIAITHHRLHEPIKPKSNTGTLTIQNYFTNNVVFTAAGNFIIGIGYLKA